MPAHGSSHHGWRIIDRQCRLTAPHTTGGEYFTHNAGSRQLTPRVENNLHTMPAHGTTGGAVVHVGEGACACARCWASGADLSKVVAKSSSISLKKSIMSSPKRADSMLSTEMKLDSDATRLFGCGDASDGFE